MSLAATSMRGARLKARLAVKGIHSSSSEGIRPGSALMGSGAVVVILGAGLLGAGEYGTRSPHERGHWRRRHRTRTASGDSATKAWRRAMGRFASHGATLSLPN